MKSLEKVFRRMANVDDEKVALQLIDSASTTRKCGSCTGCCTSLGVEEIGKPDGQPCPHLKRPGCGIYEKRPEQCRTFYCFWKLGVLSRADSPEKIGVVFDGYLDEQGRRVLRASEVWKGAMDHGKRGWAIAETLSPYNDNLLVLRIGAMRSLYSR